LFHLSIVWLHEPKRQGAFDSYTETMQHYVGSLFFAAKYETYIAINFKFPKFSSRELDVFSRAAEILYHFLTYKHQYSLYYKHIT